MGWNLLSCTAVLPNLQSTPRWNRPLNLKANTLIFDLLLIHLVVKCIFIPIGYRDDLIRWTFLEKGGWEVLVYRT